VEDLERVIDDQKRLIEALRTDLSRRLAMPFPDIVEDHATTESIWDALVRKKLITRQDVIDYSDRYGTAINAILNVLEAKNIATAQDIEDGIAVFHMFHRMGYVFVGQSYEEVSAARVAVLESVIERRSRRGLNDRSH
jgi:hypothetical protein